MKPNPYQSPATDERPPRPVPEVGGRPLASRRDRLEAAIAELFASQFLSAPLAFLPMLSLLGRSPAETAAALSGATVWTIIVLWCLSSLAAYCGLNYRSLKHRSQTVGMRWKRLRFVCKDGSPVTVGQILVSRTAQLWPIYFVPGLNALFACVSLGLALRASRSSLHDDIAGTAVVRV